MHITLPVMTRAPLCIRTRAKESSHSGCYSALCRPRAMIFAYRQQSIKRKSTSLALAVGSPIPMDDMHLLYKYVKSLGALLDSWNFYYSHSEYYKTFMGQYIWCRM